MTRTAKEQKTESRLEKFLSKTVLKNSRKKLIKRGFNHDIFRLEKGKKLYIAHIGRGRRDSGSSLLKAYRVLKFLEFKKVAFVPRVISYSKKSDILVQTYVGIRNALFKSLSNKGVKQFVAQLYLIHSLDHKEYKKYCKKHNLPIPYIESGKQSIRTYGIDRFNIVKKRCPNKRVTKWIKVRLKKNVNNVYRSSTSNKEHAHKPHICWGDIGGNIRIGGDRMYFIDWEFSSIGYGTELGYIKIHSHPTAKQFRQLVRLYSQHSGVPQKKILENIKLEERITRVNDVIWAAMKWGEAETAGDIKKYKKLTFERIKIYRKSGFK